MDANRVLAFPAQTITYTATAIDTAGCPATATFRVEVDRKRHVWAPNVICPACPDNSAFTIFGDRGVKKVNILQIYDRWGEKVWQRSDFLLNDLTLGWNGDFEGQPMNPAVFVWWAEIEYINGDKEFMSGDVTVVR